MQTLFFNQILNKEAAYRIVIDDKVFDIRTAQYCSGDKCNYVYSSDSLTFSSSVAVDVFGCVIERISVEDESSRKKIFQPYIVMFHVREILDNQNHR